MVITTRTDKGSALTYEELDNNFTLLARDRIKTQALGDISGAVNIDLSLGNFITANLIEATTLTFSGLPETGYQYSFVLAFTGIFAITFPASTKYFDAEALSVDGPEYHITCLIDESGVVTVYGVVDNIATLV